MGLLINSPFCCCYSSCTQYGGCWYGGCYAQLASISGVLHALEHCLRWEARQERDECQDALIYVCNPYGFAGRVFNKELYNFLMDYDGW